VVIGRGPRIALHYCVSMIVLFYVGRFLGVLNPVMGPAFYRPELFGYLDGSFTGKVMQSMSWLLHITPQEAQNKGGILLGGVSAMPSLHIGMVTLTAYWLAVTKRKTLFVTVPWVLLVWTSTVVLGWHYILDGVGGVALGVICVWLTLWVLDRAGVPLKAPEALKT
jgi:membrane-associated phospholipid phosphatase